MTVLRGRIWDRRRGVPLEARVQVMASTGELCAPQNALHKVGSGEPFFYAGENGFEVEVPGGPTQIVVERGTEYTPLRLTLTVPWTGTMDVDAPARALDRSTGPGLVRWQHTRPLQRGRVTSTRPPAPRSAVRGPA